MSKSSWLLLLVGVALLLGSPLIAMMPEFTPPDHCPPCINFPNVTYPLIPVGVSVGVIGLALAIMGNVRPRRVRQGPVRTWPLGFIALGLVLGGFFLLGYTIRGAGWVIALYSSQGGYLFALGVGIGLYAVFGIWANWRSAIMLSAGIIIAGFTLLLLYGTYTDFLPRCFAEVGCDPLLARSTVFGVIMLGLLLALATFVMGLGIGSFRKKTR